MRKLVHTAIGAAILASASIANAAVTVTSSTNLNDPNPTNPASVATVDGVTTINFGQNPVTTPTFSGSFVFNNDAAGLYSVVLGSSTAGLAFTAAALSGGGSTFNLAPLTPRIFTLDNAFLAAGTNYMFNFTGSSQVAGALSGNVTITAAPVPEPATWAMMLLGFGATGLMIRRRRRPAFAQIA